VSCGVVAGTELLDLAYARTRTAAVDMNVVMTGADELVEVQATGEGVSFSREFARPAARACGVPGSAQLRAEQDAAVGSPAATSS